MLKKCKKNKKYEFCLGGTLQGGSLLSNLKGIEPKNLRKRFKSQITTKNIVLFRIRMCVHHKDIPMD